ncbi:hypothetical protein EVAR_81055_1 [Eumeta japonica]|uniref:Uncharacterized protein n=1 Tax=Eumeta variegata TaxID=151549 RepID=A0A4C1T899_EUMVA|nr:hypothetical protein EVAR_81055_1 [Eumeta japonica]
MAHAQRRESRRPPQRISSAHCAAAGLLLFRYLHHCPRGGIHPVTLKNYDIGNESITVNVCLRIWVKLELLSYPVGYLNFKTVEAVFNGRDKLACQPPETRWSSPPIAIRKSRKATSGLPRGALIFLFINILSGIGRRDRLHLNKSHVAILRRSIMI